MSRACATVIIACATVILVAVASLAGCSRSDGRKAAMRSSLAATVATLERTTYPRPTTRGRPVLAGVVGDLFVARESERMTVEKAEAGAKKCAAKLAASSAPSDASGPECAEVVEARRAADSLLDLGRSDSGGAPLGAGPFALKSSSPHLRSLLALCHHSAAVVRADVLTRQPDAGALRCVETLEVARDLVYGGTTIATSAMAACMDAVMSPCRAAFEAMPAEGRARLRPDLETIATSLPPFGDAAIAELVRVDLGTCGTYFETAERERIGPRAQQLVEESDRERKALPAHETSLHLQLCLEIHEAQTLGTNAYRAPAGTAERTAALEVYEAAKKKMRIPPPAFAAYEDMYTAARTKLDELIRAAR